MKEIDMQEYVVVIGGVEHTMQLSDEDAKLRGLQPAAAKAAPKVADKARGAKNKSA